MSQLSYSLKQPIARAGLIADSTTPKEVLSYVAEGAIPFGASVALGTDTERQVALLDTDLTFLGVAAHDHGRETQRDANPASVQDKEMVNVLTKGAIWVTIEVAAVVGGDVAHYLPASGNFTKAGEIGVSTAPVGTFRTDAGVGELAILDLGLTIK